MADSAVAALTASGALTGTELFYADNLTADVKVTATQIKTFTGDVHGPGSSADNAIVRFDGTTGKLLQNSAVFVSDGGSLVVGDPALETTFWNGTFNSQILGTNNQSGYGLAVFGASVYPIIEFARSRSASIHGHTVVQNGDALGRLTFSGSDGGNFQEAARIVVAVDGVPGSGDMPGQIIFATTPDGSTGSTDRMNVRSNGRVTIGEMLKVGTTADGVAFPPPAEPSAGGTHWPLMVDYTYTNAQMEGVVYDFSGIAFLYARGHKTSGTMGQFNALIANTDMEVDSGAEVRAVQAAHMTAYAHGTGKLSTGMQGFQLEATVELDDTSGTIDGYVSAMEVYATLNSTSTCTVVYGIVAQAYTQAAAVIPDFVGGLFITEVAAAGEVGASRTVDVSQTVAGTATSQRGVQIQAPDGGGTVTDHSGLWIGDQSGFGSTTSYNINSKGDNSKNVFDGFIVSTPKTVTALGSAATAGEGAKAFVTDSTVAASGNFGAVVAGGSTNNVPVFSDGTNWRIG